MFDIRQIPFSRYGSFLTISPLFKKDQPDDLYLRSVRGGDRGNDFGKIFRLDLIGATKTQLDYKVSMSPAELKLMTQQGYVKFCIKNKRVLRFSGKGVGLRLTREGKSYDNAIRIDEEIWRVNCTVQDLRVLVSALKGNLKVDAPWQTDRCDHITIDLLPQNDNLEGAVEEFPTSHKVKTYEESYSRCKNKVTKEYSQWRQNTLDVPTEFDNGWEKASYITWSSVVPASGKLTRPAMYMSKNWMTNIWSWDNCFNALALMKNNPHLAWDQMMLFFDLQADSGVLPDFVNDRYAYFAFTKPPIEGWLLQKMLETKRNFLTEDRLAEVFRPLENWTEYWFSYTDYTGNGLPSYNHGNDAGWDNSTIFQLGGPVQSPDLLSFLILQMKALSKIAGLLGRPGREEYWQKRSEKNLKKLTEIFWTGNCFVPIKKGHSKEDFVGDSLITYIPIILGKILPDEITEKLVEDLREENRFLTKYGLATENLSSDFFEEDGYWRGPIWAPSTMLIVEGLSRSGRAKLARDIAQRFVEMADKSGMAENFNPLNGEGLRDQAFTWTSSIFLYLGNKILNFPDNEI